MGYYNSPQSIEPEIIARVKCGDHMAFDALYHMYARRLQAYAMEKVKSVQDTEDLVQDVFASVWSSRGRITNNITLYPLLFTVLRHGISRFNRLRHNAPLSIECFDNLAIERMAPECCYPIEYDEFQRSMFNYIGKLTHTEQSVLKLSRFDCKTNKQIALNLGLSDQTVRNALSNGLRKLRAALLRDNIAI